MTNLLLRNIRMNGLVVLISIVGDKSHQCEEVVRTIRILFHLPVDLDIIMRDIIIHVVINHHCPTLSAISGGRISRRVVAARRFIELFLIGPRGKSAYLVC